MAIDFAKLITLAVEEGGDQGIYNWPSQVSNVLKKRYGELGLTRDQVGPGGEYGNTFQGALGALLPANIESTFMANANMYARTNGVPIGVQVLQDLNNRRDSVNTTTDADFMKLKAAGDLASGNITPAEARNINSYVGNLSSLKDASSAANQAQNRINSLESQIAQTQQQYDNSPLGKESTKGTYEPRLASLRAQLEEARAALPTAQSRLDQITSSFNNAYNNVANLNASMSIVPASQAATILSGGATAPSVQSAVQRTIDQTASAQQAAQQAAQPAQQAAQQTTQQLPAELTNIPVDDNYSMDEKQIIEGLIRSGRISTKQVSDYFNVPISRVDTILQETFGYTPENLSRALAGQGIAAPTGTITTNGGTMPTGGGTISTGGVTTGNMFSGMNTTEDQALARRMGMSPLEYAQAGGLGANADMSVLLAAQQGVGQDIAGVMGGQQGYTSGTLQNGNVRYNDPNVIGGQVNMPQVGVIGAESALQGGLAGALAGLQQGIGEARTGLLGSSQGAINQLQSGLATGATGLTQATASGLQELRRALGQGRQDITAGYGRAEAGFQPYMAGGEAAQAQLEALTGARGQEAFQQAYQESPYIQFLREQGMRANLAGAAATGGLGGGNVQRELARFGQGLASQGLQQQIQNLQGLTGQGLQAAQGAGQYAAGGAGQLAGLEQTQGTQALGAMQNVGQGLANLGQIAGTQGAGIMQNVGQQLANLGLAGGQTAAQMGYGTGQKLADIRTRAGELMAGEISNVSRDTANLAAALGGDISGVYGTQSKNLADLLTQSGMSQADATRIAAQLLSNIATGAAGQVAGLGTSVGQPQQTQGILGQVGQAASGIGTAAAGLATLSDIRAKENISKIGQLPSGLGLYSWDWKASAPSDAKDNPTVGVIAQEVQQLMPEAIVQREDGYMAVDYSKVN